jgi:hypothetical protein
VDGTVDSTQTPAAAAAEQPSPGPTWQLGGSKKPAAAAAAAGEGEGGGGGNVGTVVEEEARSGTANVLAAVLTAAATAVVEAPLELFRHNSQAGQFQGNFVREMWKVSRHWGCGKVEQLAKGVVKGREGRRGRVADGQGES